MTTYPFLSSTSANAVISDLRPTTLSSQALDHINLLLDEVLTSLVTAAESLNPRDLRSTGVPAVFSGGQAHGESTGIKALGRAAVAEAEVEVRSWYDSNPGPKTGFPPANGGRGMTASKEVANAKFPLDDAITLLRIKCASFSTYAPNPPPPDDEVEDITAAWKRAGGDISEATTDIVGLWMTGVLEHICEHILQQLGRVVARDSSITVAGVQDLYTAIAEDESVWGFVKRLKVRDTLEQAVQSANAPKSRRGTPNRPSTNGLGDRFSPSNSSPHASRVSLGGAGTPPGLRDASIDSTRKNTGSPTIESSRGSFETNRFAGIASVTRKGSSMSKRFGVGHDRKDSGLSVNTRSILTAYNEKLESEDGSKRSKSPQEDEEEFDALVRSGETMKVSLTPSRLRTFESGAAGKKGLEGQAGLNRRERAGSVPDLSAPPLPTSDTVPSLSHSTSASFSSPARGSPIRHAPVHRTAPGSAIKLQARGAKTIDERDEEEPALGGSSTRKESLKEIFSSAPNEDFDSSPQKRTVPALILGGPPPGSSAFSPVTETPPNAMISETNSLRRGSANRLTPAEDEDTDMASARTPASSINRPHGGARGGRTTEARELADFFNSTPPPSSSSNKSRTPNNDLPPSAKSSKGFRGLMSKVTGGGNSNKKREEEKRLAREREAIMEIPTAPSPNTARRQRSMASVVSSATAPAHTSNRSEMRGFEEVPPNVQPRSVLRKKSDAAQTATSGDSTTTSFAPLWAITKERSSTTSTPRTTPPLPPLQHYTPTNGESPNRHASPGAGAIPALETRNSNLSTPPSARQSTTPPRSYERPAASELLTSARSIKSTNEEKSRETFPDSLNATQIPSSALPQSSSVPPIPTSRLNEIPFDGSSSRPGYSERTSTAVSDANSFMTADEGDDLEDNDEQGDSSGRRRAVDAAGDPLLAQSVPLQATDELPSVGDADQLSPPSIPMTKLLPLRNLLQHATSAAECRLLLSAILTQLGVPVDESSSELQPDPETRIVAWLLAGTDGPPVGPCHSNIGVSPSNNAATPSEADPEQDEGTPKVSLAVLTDDNHQEPPGSAVRDHQEELLSETESAISTMEEEGTTSFAQAGQRSSPVRLATAA